MADTSAPFSYSFEGQKTNVPLAVDSATGPEEQGRNKRKEGKVVARFRHGRKGKRH